MHKIVGIDSCNQIQTKMVRAPCCDKANIIKGPWSSTEDAKLTNFVATYGNGGNWITLPEKAGLRRCGKSCRFRWINYLRPDIKRGKFTKEEVATIWRVYGEIGRKWSVIAGHLPGRTDNDIKNFCNTMLKKKVAASSVRSPTPCPSSPTPPLASSTPLPALPTPSLALPTPPLAPSAPSLALQTPFFTSQTPFFTSQTPPLTLPTSSLASRTPPLVSPTLSLDQLRSYTNLLWGHQIIANSETLPSSTTCQELLQKDQQQQEETAMMQYFFEEKELKPPTER